MTSNTFIKLTTSTVGTAFISMGFCLAPAQATLLSFKFNTDFFDHSGSGSGSFTLDTSVLNNLQNDSFAAFYSQAISNYIYQGEFSLDKYQFLDLSVGSFPGEDVSYLNVVRSDSFGSTYAVWNGAFKGNSLVSTLPSSPKNYSYIDGSGYVIQDSSSIKTLAVTAVPEPNNTASILAFCAFLGTSLLVKKPRR